MDTPSESFSGANALDEVNLSDIIINSLPGVFFLQTWDGKFLRWNTNMEIMSGYSKEELTNMNAMEFFAPEDHEFVYENVRKAYKVGSIKIDVNVIIKDKTVVPCLFTCSGITYNGQYCLIGTGIDITEKKKAEEVLQKSQAELSAIFTNTDTSYILLDSSFKVITLNAIAAEKSKLFFGNSVMVGENFIDKLPDARKEIARASFLRVLQGETVAYEADYSIYDIGDNYFSVKMHPIKSSTGGVYGVCFSSVDITDRKLAELKVKKSEEKYHSLFEQATDAIFIADFEANFIDINEGMCSLLGYTKEELLAMNASDLIDSENLKSFPIPFDRLISGEHMLNKRKVIHKDGTLLDFEINIKRLGDNMIMAIARDVTEMLKVQQQVEISEATFRGAFEHSAIGMGIVSLEGKWLRINKELCGMLGYTNDEFLTRTFQDITHPDDVEIDVKHLEQFKSGEIDTYRSEKRYMHKNGNLVWGSLNVALIKDAQAKPLYFISQIEDITGKKQAEIEVRESQKKYHSLFEQATDAIMVTDLKGNFIDVNESMCKLFDYTKEELLSMNIGQMIDAQQLTDNPIKFDKLSQGQHIHNYRRMLHKNGSIVEVEANVKSFGEGMIMAIARDVTEKKLIEAELKDAEAKFRGLVEKSLVGVYIIHNGKFAYVNPRFAQIFDYTQDELINSYPVEVVVKEEDRHITLQNIKDRIGGDKESVQYEVRGRKKNGETIWIEVFGNRTQYKGETAIIGTLIDTTDRKKAEEALRSSEQTRRHIMDSSLDAIVCIDNNGDIILWTPRAEETFGWKESEVIGKTLVETIIPQQYRGKHLDGILKYKQTGEGPILNKLIEISALHKDGHEFPIEMSIATVKNDNDEFFCGFIRDITRRKTAAARLKESEEQLRLFIEHSPAALAMFDNKMQYIVSSKRWAEDYNISNESLVGKSHYEVFPEIQQSWKEIHQRSLKGIIEKNEEDLFIREDGTETWVKWEIHPWYKADSSIGGIIMFTEVITERKKIEAEKERTRYLLNERIKELGTLYRTSQLLQGANKDIEATLQALVNLLPDGWQYKEITAARVSFNNKEYKTPNYGAGFACQLAEFNTSDGTTGAIEVVYLEEKPQEAEGPFLKEERDLLNMLAEMVHSYLDQIRDERQREKITNDLIQRNKDLEQFAYIISHNLRAPVANIMGFSEVLSEDGVDIDTQKIYLGELNTSVSKLDDVIRDLNNILQVRREVSEVKEKVSFAKTVHNVEVSIKNMIAKENAHIEIDFSAVDEITTLKSYIHSIFYNLISNSIKYRKPDVAPLISIKSHKEGKKVILEFTDNGLGIDMARKGDQVFGLYKRFHTHAEGKGIGLYMTKTQIETLGGTISIDSKVGEGTHFTIELPA